MQWLVFGIEWSQTNHLLAQAKVQIDLLILTSYELVHYHPQTDLILYIRKVARLYFQHNYRES